jgi:tetratricopeptide (TPR) repeat protein
MKKSIIKTSSGAVFLPLFTAQVFAQGAGIEWDILIKEVRKLERAEKYDRAVTVAKKALEVAMENAGPGHRSVATSLNNLALLYNTQGHYAQAEPLYKRWTSGQHVFVP